MPQTKTEASHLVDIVVLKTIPRLGIKGSVVKANAGWMRHELFPLGLAVYATPENIQRYSLTEAQKAAMMDPEKVKQRRLEKLVHRYGMHAIWY